MAVLPDLCGCPFDCVSKISKPCNVIQWWNSWFPLSIAVQGFAPQWLNGWVSLFLLLCDLIPATYNVLCTVIEQYETATLIPAQADLTWDRLGYCCCECFVNASWMLCGCLRVYWRDMKGQRDAGTWEDLGSGLVVPVRLLLHHSEWFVNWHWQKPLCPARLEK